MGGNPHYARAIGAGGKRITKEEMYKWETQLARPFLKNYVSSGWPRDRLIRIDDSGNTREYPLDHPLYVPAEEA